MRETIGIDLDDTLNNHVNMWLMRYNEDYNDNKILSDVTTWDIHTILKPECGMKIHDYCYEPDWFYNLDIQKDAYEVTKWLVNHYDLYIVTAYIPEACVSKAKWIDKYLPHIGSKNIIFCNNKGLINTNYLIDDGGHNITAFKNNALVFDKPWNRHLSKEYPRMLDWMYVFKYFLDKVYNKSNY